jgi:hypothetical protein
MVTIEGKDGNVLTVGNRIGRALVDAGEFKYLTTAIAPGGSPRKLPATPAKKKAPTKKKSDPDA